MSPELFYTKGGKKVLTKIDLCSMALLKLGEPAIQSLTDDSAAAQLSRTLFDTITDGLLALYPWRFATKEFDLPRNTDGDFTIPSDVLRITKCNGQIIGNRVISPSDSMSITAVMRTTPDKFPSYFVSLVTTKLAMEFCIPLLGDSSLFRMLATLYESELQSAKFIDSTTSPTQGITDFSLINARF